MAKTVMHIKAVVRQEQNKTGKNLSPNSHSNCSIIHNCMKGSVTEVIVGTASPVTHPSDHRWDSSALTDLSD